MDFLWLHNGDRGLKRKAAGYTMWVSPKQWASSWGEGFSPAQKELARSDGLCMLQKAVA